MRYMCNEHTENIMNRDEEEWAKAFEGQDESGILVVPLPPNLSDAQCFRFRSL